VLLVRSEVGGPPQIGEPIDASSALVTGGRLMAGQYEYAEQDPHCCPSIERYAPIDVAARYWSEHGYGPGPGNGTTSTTGGLGPVRIGATFAEVAAATGEVLTAADDLQTQSACVSVPIPSFKGRGYGLGGDGRLRSLEIDDPNLQTKSGLGIGSTEADVAAALGDVAIGPHPCTDGHYVTLTTAVGTREVVFETDGSGIVTRYRVGEPGRADAAEGCA
jgi:hypothetical protein